MVHCRVPLGQGRRQCHPPHFVLRMKTVSVIGASVAAARGEGGRC